MLIEIDSRPIRRSYTARLRRARRAITRLESQIARYHEADAPAFYLWYHREFGQILSHHRGLREQIAAHEFLERDPEGGMTDRTDTAFSRPKTPATEASPECDLRPRNIRQTHPRRMMTFRRKRGSRIANANAFFAASLCSYIPIAVAPWSMNESFGGCRRKPHTSMAIWLLSNLSYLDANPHDEPSRCPAHRFWK